MNKKELELATRLLTANILTQARKVVPSLAANVVAKFDQGPKPSVQDKAQVSLKIEIAAQVMYDIENKVRRVKNKPRK